MMWFAYSMCWVATAGATSVGIYYTKSPHCLWAMLIPALISFKTGPGKAEAK